jgi:phosphatidylinositol alpha-1,6-mannosyltransferase
MLRNNARLGVQVVDRTVVSGRLPVPVWYHGAVRLVFVSHSFPPVEGPMRNVGGMQRVATELHAALETRNDITMRTIALRTSWRWIHVKTTPFLLSLAFRLRREAERFAADAILFTSMTTALPLLLAGSRLRNNGVRLGAIAHGLDVTAPNPAYQIAVGRLCGLLDVAMPVSRATADALVARGMPTEKVEVVPNAVDFRRFEGFAASPDVRGAVNIAGAPPLDEEAFLIVAVGRQVRRKGFAWFVEQVMPRVPERVVFWLAGDGPERDEIHSTVERTGLQRRVHLFGRISEGELLELYRSAQLLVMPNIVVPDDMEGFGIVMLEAGACGIPTLAADLEGIRDVVEEGVNGWLVATEDAEAFAERIRWLLAEPEELRAAGKRSARYVRETFRWERTVERYVDLLRRR